MTKCITFTVSKFESFIHVLVQTCREDDFYDTIIFINWLERVNLWHNYSFRPSFYFLILGNSSSGYRLCSKGFYCPAGTGRNESACPAGTYSDQLGLTDASFCLQCTGGKYCDVTNLTAPAGDCSPGYYCTEGVNTPTPTGNHTGVGGICPQGYMCPGSTVVPQGCPAGTYQVRSRSKFKGTISFTCNYHWEMFLNSFYLFIELFVGPDKPGLLYILPRWILLHSKQHDLYWQALPSGLLLPGRHSVWHPVPLPQGYLQQPHWSG